MWTATFKIPASVGEYIYRVHAAYTDAGPMLYWVGYWSDAYLPVVAPICSVPTFNKPPRNLDSVRVGPLVCRLPSHQPYRKRRQVAGVPTFAFPVHRIYSAYAVMTSAGSHHVAFTHTSYSHTYPSACSVGPLGGWRVTNALTRSDITATRQRKLLELTDTPNAHRLDDKVCVVLHPFSGVYDGSLVPSDGWVCRVKIPDRAYVLYNAVVSRTGLLAVVHNDRLIKDRTVDVFRLSYTRHEDTATANVALVRSFRVEAEILAFSPDGLTLACFKSRLSRKKTGHKMQVTLLDMED